MAVDTHGLGQQAQRGKFQHQHNDNHAGNGNEHRGGHRDSGNKVAEIAEAGFRNDGQLVVVDPGGDGTACRKQNQCGNHGLNLKVRNQGAVEGAEKHTHHTGSQESNNDGGLHGLGTGTLIAAENAQNHGTRNGDVGANGNILSAGSGGNQGHADGQNHQLGGVVQNGNQIAGQHGVAVAVLAQGDLKEAGIRNQVKQYQQQQCRHRNENLIGGQLFEFRAEGLLLRRSQFGHISFHLPQWLP